ncbi:MAG: DNA polymerase IV [Clostridia bacterium]|nr:DNA polymerase IV [Clostridia bacterium]
MENGTEPLRSILHCDCNNFFASCELLSRPDLRNSPVAVTGDPTDRHGIVVAKNDIAKKYGVRTAETIYSARQKCPQLVCLPAHHDLYSEISKKVNAIYLQYTDLVDPFGIDESFLDITGSLTYLKKTPHEVADELRARVKAEIGITISVGVSFCKVFAKLGSDYKKPDATTEITPQNKAEIVDPLPASDLLYVGKQTNLALNRMGIFTIGQLAQTREEDLEEVLGEAGKTLWIYANGLDREPVHAYHERREVKSVGNSMTFRRDISGEEEIRQGLSELADSVASRLRRANLKGSVLQIQVKDPNFRVVQKQCQLNEPTWLKSVLVPRAMQLISAMHMMDKPVRLLSLTVTGLIPADQVERQLTIFDNPDGESGDKKEMVEDVLADIRSRYGRNSIFLGMYENPEIGIRHKES